MSYSDTHAHSRATIDAHSLGRTLLVAILVSLAPIVAMVAVTAVGLTLAFLGGVATSGVLALARGTVRSRREGSLNESTTVVGTAN